MKLRLSPLLPPMHIGLEKLRVRLPASAWRLLHTPVPRIFRESSLSEDLERQSVGVGLPDSFSIDFRILQTQSEFRALRREDGAGAKIFRLADATVLGNGIILHKGAIHRCSSVYRRLSPKQILAAAQEYQFNKGRRPVLDAATIVSRQFVTDGTWGDYFLEFLMPMAWVPPLSGRIVLCDSGFVSKYSPGDREALDFECCPIPTGGIQVKDLEVIGPCQVFNNFEEANIGKLHERFPVEADRSLSDKVFLSRLGVCCENTKNDRAIANEAEVAAYLVSEGFDILRPHEMTNNEIRSRIAGADVIVGCWGAAMLNTAWSRPKTVIELVSEKIWSPTAVKLSLANGVERHIAIRTTNHRISIDLLAKALQTQNRREATSVEFTCAD